MYKYIAIAIVIIGFVFAIMNSKINSLTEENILLKTQIKDLQYAVEKYNDAQERAGEKIEKVRTIVRNVKSDCDCWNTPIDERVRNEIRKNRK